MASLSVNILVFLALLYFLQGLPYGLQARFLPIYFRTQYGMSLSSLGLFKLLLVPWMCKALWAPLVDKYGTKRLWLLYSMLGLGLTCLLGAASSPSHIPQVAGILFLFNLLTATQDIAVDGLAIQLLTTSQLASGNIAQVVGYKIGAVCSGGVLIWLSDYLNWGSLFVGLATVYFLAFASVWQALPGTQSGSPSETSKTETDTETEGSCGEPPTDSRHWLLKHFTIIFKDQETRWIVGFVLLVKLGENGALSMMPLFLVDQHITASSVGFWTGVIGQFVSIGSSMLGGWLISYQGFTPYRIIKFFCQLRIVFLLIQLAAVVSWQPNVNSTMLYVVTVASMNFMLVGSGIITTATFTLMMFCSQRKPASVQASHYTTLATMEVLGKLTFSVLIGPLTDITGYPIIFTLFVTLSVVLLPVLNRCPPALRNMLSTSCEKKC